MSGAKRDAWIDAIETHQEFEHYSQRYKICHLHFKTEDIINIEGKIHLKNDAIPTIFNSSAGKTFY